MSDLISRKKICDYIKGKINPYVKPFKGTTYELGLKIMKYINAMDSAYSVDKVVEELEELKMRYFLTIANTGDEKSDFAYENVGNALDKAIEIVKHGCASDDVCEWKLTDTRKVMPYKTSCGNEDLYDNSYKYCPYCGKKIKVIGD